MGNHNNLVTVIGKLKNHPEQKMGLVLELIPPSFKNLAGPPSFDTCTRDTFKEGTQFSSETILKISQSIADASKHLHSKGIMHGDLYAHNTLFDDKANTIFGDFGAATLYDLNDKNAAYKEKLDVRAFGCLMEDLLNCPAKDNDSVILRNLLTELKDKCMHEEILSRPNFSDIINYLNTFC